MIQTYFGIAEVMRIGALQTLACPHANVKGVVAYDKIVLAQLADLARPAE